MKNDIDLLKYTLIDSLCTLIRYQSTVPSRWFKDRLLQRFQNTDNWKKNLRECKKYKMCPTSVVTMMLKQSTLQRQHIEASSLSTSCCWTLGCNTDLLPCSAGRFHWKASSVRSSRYDLEVLLAGNQTGSCGFFWCKKSIATQYCCFFDCCTTHSFIDSHLTSVWKLVFSSSLLPE